MASISFDRVGKVYPDGHRAVSALDLHIEDGEFVVLVGPSGCGKTTALRMVAGLEDVSEGELRVGETVVNTVEPRKRDVAMVFQNYALYPHMTVFDNIAFPLRSRRLPRQEIRERVVRVARLLDLEEYLKRRPRTLSGGQRQRVAMGRAIVREPQAFLMDEPLSNLDAKLRVQMRGEISRLQRELEITTLYVTHDQVEAMTMGNRIAVMRKGELQQQGPAQQVYDEPSNLFVATFIGSPAMNVLRARIEKNGSGLVCALSDQMLSLTQDVMAQRPKLSAYVGREVALGLRPEDLTNAGGGDDTRPRLRGGATMVETVGAEQYVTIEIEAEPVISEDVLEVARDIDAAVVQSLREGAQTHRVPVVARFPPGVRVTAGKPAEAAIDFTRARFFDVDTGAAITK